MATPKHKKLHPWGREIYNWSLPYLDYQYYILRLSDPCPEVKKKRRNNAFSIYNLYGHARAQTLLHRGHGIYNFVISFPDHHNYKRSLSYLCPGVEKKILKKTSIVHFYSKNYLPMRWGQWNLQFLVSLPYTCYIPNLVKIGPVVVNARHTTHDDGRQPIAMSCLLTL